MLNLDAYLKNPCGTLSIPYWKNKNIVMPDNMRIVHDSAFCVEMLSGYTDEPYFRLLHNLESINTMVPERFLIKTATEKDLSVIVDVINRSYPDISVTLDQVLSFRQHHTYDSSLWILVLDKQTSKVMGCGIAELDPEASEGVLEWIQVLPECRGQGIGQLIVNQLLRRIQGKAKFATVSGKVDNETKPELLYRKCGFSGNDLWHILRKR